MFCISEKVGYGECDAHGCECRSKEILECAEQSPSSIVRHIRVCHSVGSLCSPRIAKEINDVLSSTDGYLYLMFVHLCS